MIAKHVRDTHPMERLDRKPAELYGLLNKSLAWKLQLAVIDNAMYTIIPGKKIKFKNIPDRLDRGVLVMRPPKDTSSNHSAANNKFRMPFGEVLVTDTNVRGSIERIITGWTGWQLDEVVASLPERIIAGESVTYTYIVTVTIVSSTVGIEYFQPTGSRDSKDYEWLLHIDDIKHKEDMFEDTPETALLAFKYKTKHWDTLENMLYKKAGEACEHSKDYEYNVRVAVLLPPEQSKGAEPSLLILQGKSGEKWQPVGGILSNFTTEMTIYDMVKQFVFINAGLLVNKIIACVQEKPRFIEQENKVKQGAVVLEYLVGVLPTKDPDDNGQTKVKHDENKFIKSKWVSSLDGLPDLGVGCRDFIDRALPLAREYVETGVVKFQHDRWAVTKPGDKQPVTRAGPSAFKSTNMEEAAANLQTYFDVVPSSLYDVSSTFHPTPAKDEDYEDDIIPTPPPSYPPIEPLWSAGYVPTLAQATSVNDDKALGSRSFPVLGTAKHRPVKPSGPTVLRQKKLTQTERRRQWQQANIDEEEEFRAMSEEQRAAATLAPQSEGDDDDNKPTPDAKGKGKAKQVDSDSDDLSPRAGKDGKKPAKDIRKPKVDGRGKVKHPNSDSDSDPDDLFPRPSKENKKPSKMNEDVEDPIEKERKAMRKFQPNGYYPGETLQSPKQDTWTLPQDEDSD